MQATTLAAWAEQLRMLDGVRAALDVFQPIVFERTAADLVAATASKQWREQHDVPMGYWVRRRLRKQSKDMLRPGRPIADLHAALLEVQAQREVWQAHCPSGGWPRLPDGLELIEEEFAAVRADLDALDEVLAGTPLRRRAVRPARSPRCSSASPGCAPTPPPWRRCPTAPACCTACATPGSARWSRTWPRAGPTRRSRRPSSTSPGGARSSSRSSPTTPRSPATTAPPSAPCPRTTRTLDRAHVDSLPGPVLTSVVGHIGAALRQHRDQAEALFADLVEERLTTLRDTVTRHPDVARRLRPVIAASPMLVPQVLPPTRTVDLVVLDSAAHLPVEVALAAIARGRQVVVARRRPLRVQHRGPRARRRAALGRAAGGCVAPRPVPDRVPRRPRLRRRAAPDAAAAAPPARAPGRRRRHRDARPGQPGSSTRRARRSSTSSSWC